MFVHILTYTFNMLPKFLHSFNLIITLLLFSCSDDTLFKVMEADETGLYFNNEVQKYVNDTLNPITFDYIYDGAGVATGDINNDGLSDIYFAGNFVSGKLFLNEGDLKFKDITEEAKVSTNRWGTGASMVDINKDGLLDIYVCIAGPSPNKEDLRNHFFINQGMNENGVPEFKDMAPQYGLDDPGYSTMAAFFDYDKDNDLDVYILTNALEDYNRNGLKSKVVDGSAPSNDRLYRNNGDNTFTNVNQEAGILIEGWGLGVCIADVNQDNWPDIYVANDFLSNDLLWINQKDGTFKNEIDDYLRHQTYNGMGIDIADYNNDLRPDIVVLDMLPRDNYREKMMIPGGNYDIFLSSRQAGYQDQYMRNTLQLNQGTFPDGSPRFSEIAYLAGMFKTDWSWAPLFADFDNDGLKDLFISNGYRKDVTDLDFIIYNRRTSSNIMFGTESAKMKKRGEALADRLKELDDVKLSNRIFHNEGNLTFNDYTKKWGLDIPTFSNGVAYADLDNDGDLDIVVNNMDDNAMIMDNTLYQSDQPAKNHYLRIKLTSDNKVCNNSKVWIITNGSRQYLEYSPYRGYKSTVEPYLHFGVGDHSTVDTLTVIWPDKTITRRLDINTNQTIEIKYKSGEKVDPSALPAYMIVKSKNPDHEKYMFVNVSDSSKLAEEPHHEDFQNDFRQTPMLPHLLSEFGPYVAVGDLNGDTLEDVVLGNDAGIPTKLMFQSSSGKFEKKILPGDSIYEDRRILLFDLENDGDKDIYVVSGGSKWPQGNKNYQDRIYVNNGKGDFTVAHDILPEMHVSSNTAVSSDVDSDGDMDIFVGGYLVPQKYPYCPKSYLLINDNGKFIDKTDDIAPGLKQTGMVTDATWADINGDNKEDLIIVGEWMPITLYLNDKNGRLHNATSKYGLENTNGWYYSVLASDLNADGNTDIIVGNTGENSYYKPSVEEPVEIFTKDYDNNGTVDPIMTHYNQGERYISFFRDRLIKQIPRVKGFFNNYEKFASTTFDNTFTKKDMKGAQHLKCNSLTSLVLENTRNKLIIHPLPVEAQISTIKGITSGDFNADGARDIIVIGNSDAEESIRGNYDASYGLFMTGDNQFGFSPHKPSVSGLVTEGTPQQIVQLTIDNNPHLLITRNGATPLLYEITNYDTKKKLVQ